MTQAAVAHSELVESSAAGADVARQITAGLGGDRPDALLVFASAAHDYTALLRAIDEGCSPRTMVGCSSAGEYTSQAQSTGSVSAVALRSSDMQFAAGLGRGLRSDLSHAVAELGSALRGFEQSSFTYRYALVLTDALAGRADELIDELTHLTAGAYQFFGGGAGDDARFEQTHVFCGREAVADAAVVLEILSNKPVGIGVRHGWQPASEPMRVTEADGMRLRSLNAAPAVDMFEDHAQATGQRFEASQPLPFFLQNVLGIDAGAGYKLRVPLGVGEDGSVLCAADIPTGATAHIMGTTARSAADAAAAATLDAVGQLGGLTPRVGLFFDCVATRLRTGAGFGDELRSVQEALGPDATFGGCNTYGQIARVDGQFSGFHNCTAVVCVIPD
jgi:hypothetical protein